MQRVHETVVIHGPLGGNQGLRDDLTAENPLPADLRAFAPEQVLLQLLEIERGDEIGHRV
ncbi:hypothetical protein D3C72_1090970 [compost metagenome]